MREAEVKALFTADFGGKFNLLTDSPLRLRLLETKPGKYVLGIVAHHLALDGWSLARLLEKSCDAYNALAGNEALPALPWQPYWNYMDEYYRQIGHESSAKSAAFWRGQDLKSPPLLQPYAEKTRGHRVIYILNKKYYQKVKDLAKANRVTPFLFLLHAFSRSLSKVVARPEFIISVPIASRDWDQAEFVLGNCVNLLPMKVTLSQDALADLAKIRATYLDSIAHSLVPFQKIQADQSEDLSQIHFNFEPSVEEPELTGLEIDFFPFPVNQVEKPIIINVNDTKKTYYIEIDYQAEALDLMKALTIFTETERVINRMEADRTRES